jgi:hypothetical protein
MNDPLISIAQALGDKEHPVGGVHFVEHDEHSVAVIRPSIATTIGKFCRVTGFLAPRGAKSINDLHARGHTKMGAAE